MECSGGGWIRQFEADKWMTISAGGKPQNFLPSLRHYHLLLFYVTQSHNTRPATELSNARQVSLLTTEAKMK